MSKKGIVMGLITTVMDKLNSLAGLSYWGNDVISWLTAAAVLVVVALVIHLIKRIIIRKCSALAARSETHWDDLAIDLIRKTKSWFAFLIGVSAASMMLVLPGKTRALLQSVLLIALLLQSGIWISFTISTLLERYRQKQLKTDPAGVTTLNAVGFISKIILWAIVLLLALDNLGVNITALVAGLGVGGIAVALAVQNILGDLFASLSIVLDKPFVMGDFLIIDDYMGRVEHVGLKTSRLRSLSGEQLVFSNSDLLGSRIRNYGRMFERRVMFSLGVTYQTPRDKLKLIPDILRTAVESQERTRFDRAHFKAYGNFSLDFETVYYVLVSDYNVYMDIQQAVNLFIHEQFEQEGIEFAYPTQTLFLQSEDKGT